MVNNNRSDRGANRKRGNDRQMTAEEKNKQLARELRITEKTKQFYDEVIQGNHQTIRKAYKTVRPETTDNNASINASKLLASPKYSIYKASAVGRAKRRVVELVDSKNEQIALKASQDIIDRTEGKPVQRNETTSKTVEVKVDLSGARLGAHYVAPEEIPIIPENT